MTSGLHEALTRKYLGLIIAITDTHSLLHIHIHGPDNFADAGTRSPLINDIVSVRDTCDSIDCGKKRMNPPTEFTAYLVRKRCDLFSNDTVGRRVCVRRLTIPRRSKENLKKNLGARETRWCCASG